MTKDKPAAALLRYSHRPGRSFRLDGVGRAKSDGRTDYSPRQGPKRPPERATAGRTDDRIASLCL